MDIASIMQTGNPGAIQEACDTVRRRAAEVPLTFSALAELTGTIAQIQAHGAIQVRRQAGIAPHPPTPGAGDSVAGLPRYLADLVDHYPFELEPPAALFNITPAASGLIVPLLNYAPIMFPAAGDVTRHVRLMEWLLPGVEAHVHRHAGREDAGFLLEKAVSTCNMLPLYFADHNLAPLAKVRARLTTMLLQRLGKPVALDPPRQVRTGARRRVGVFRNVFNNASEVAALRAHLLPYDRSRYEITLYALSEARDSGEERMKADFDRFVLLDSEEPDDIVRRLRADELDILLMGKNICGLNNIPWVVGAHRIAPLQIATTLFPITTGLPTFDAYFTGALNESRNAADQYSETLVLAPGSINAYDFSGPPLSPASVGLRQRLGLTGSEPVFVSGANLHKITPELLAVWSAILNRVPGARLALYPFNRNWSTSYEYSLCATYLYQQFAANGIPKSRVTLFSTFETRAAILGLLSEADIYLDSFPFSGAVSIVDPLLCDCPVVALEGVSARCRQSAGFLRGLGLDHMVTGTVDDYITRAVALGLDAGLRAHDAQRIRTARPPGFPAAPSLSGHFWRAVETLVERSISRQ